MEGGTIISAKGLSMDSGNDGLLEIGPGSTLTVGTYLNAEWAGYVIRVRGGGSDINLGGNLFFGVYGVGNAMRYELVLDASGLSTINAAALELDDTKLPELEFSGSGAPDTYTILHTNSDPTSELGEFASVVYGAGFSNLQVVDLTATTGGYDVTVDYGAGPQMGDVNLSGLVDDDDLSLLLANWNIGDEWGEGDLDNDDTVDDDDLSLLLANWGLGGSAVPQAVPEPMTLGLLALGGLGVLFRRRRK